MDENKEKVEKSTQDNIQKFDEEYKQSRVIPKDYKKKIRNRILKNSIIAIIIIVYLISINVLSLYMETPNYIFSMKLVCIILAIICVIYFELSYRKDSGYLFLHGAEFLVLAMITLFNIYAYSLFYASYNKILIYISIVVVVYYVIKTIVTLRNMKKQYYESLNDIKEIVKKGNVKND